MTGGLEVLRRTSSSLEVGCIATQLSKSLCIKNNKIKALSETEPGRTPEGLRKFAL
jgi:hypothetical protein